MSRQVARSYFPDYTSSRRTRRANSDERLSSMVSDDVSSVHSSELGFSVDSSIHTSKYCSSDDDDTLESFDNKGRRVVRPKMSLTSTKSSIPPWEYSDVTSLGASTLDYTIESKREREIALTASEMRRYSWRGRNRGESRFVSRSKSLGSRFSRSGHSRSHHTQKKTKDDINYRVSRVDTRDNNGYEVSPKESRRSVDDRELKRAMNTRPVVKAEVREKHVPRSTQDHEHSRKGRSNKSQTTRSMRRAESRCSTPPGSINRSESYDTYEISPVPYGCGSGYEVSPTRSDYPEESSVMEQARSPLAGSRSSRSSHSRTLTSPTMSNDDDWKSSRTESDDYKAYNSGNMSGKESSYRADKSLRSCRSGHTKSETDHSTSIDEHDSIDVRRAETTESEKQKHVDKKASKEYPSIEQTRSTWSGVIWARRSESETMDGQESYGMSRVEKSFSSHSRKSERSRQESSEYERPKKTYSSHSRRSENSRSTEYGGERPEKTYSSHSRISDHSRGSKTPSTPSKSMQSGSHHKKQGKREASEPRLRNVDYMTSVDIASSDKGLSTVAPIGKEEAKEAFHHEIPHEVPIPSLGDDISSIGNTRVYEYSRQLVKVEPRIDEEAGGFEQEAKKTSTKGVLTEEDKNRLEYFFVGVICVSLVTLIVLLGLVVTRK